MILVLAVCVTHTVSVDVEGEIMQEPYCIRIYGFFSLWFNKMHFSNKLIHEAISQTSCVSNLVREVGQRWLIWIDYDLRQHRN